MGNTTVLSEFKGEGRTQAALSRSVPPTLGLDSVLKQHKASRATSRLLALSSAPAVLQESHTAQRRSLGFTPFPSKQAPSAAAPNLCQAAAEPGASSRECAHPWGAVLSGTALAGRGEPSSVPVSKEGTKPTASPQGKGTSSSFSASRSRETQRALTILVAE